MNTQNDLGSIGLERMKDVFTSIEKKRRNLDKRKNKLDVLKVQKGPLNTDQQTSIAKYGEVEASIVLMSEILSQLDGMIKDTEKSVKKAQKLEKFERKKQEVKMVDFSLRLYNGLDRLVNTESVEKALVKSSGFTEDDLCILKFFQASSAQRLSSNPASSRSSVAGEMAAAANSQNADSAIQNKLPGWKYLSERYLALFENSDRLCFESTNVEDSGVKPQLLATLKRSDMLGLALKLIDVAWLMSDNFSEEARIIVHSKTEVYKDGGETEDDDVEYEDAQENANDAQQTPVAQPAVSHMPTEVVPVTERYRTQSYGSDQLAASAHSEQLQYGARPQGDMAAHYTAREEDYPVQVTTGTSPLRSKDQELNEVITPLQTNFNFLQPSCISDGSADHHQPTADLRHTIPATHYQSSTQAAQCQQQALLPEVNAPMVNNSAAVAPTSAAPVNPMHPIHHIMNGAPPKPKQEREFANWGDYDDDSFNYKNQTESQPMHPKEDVFASAHESEFLHSKDQGGPGFRGGRGAPRGGTQRGARGMGAGGPGGGGGSFRGNSYGRGGGASTGGRGGGGGYGPPRANRGGPRGGGEMNRGGRGSFNGGRGGGSRFNGNAAGGNMRRQEVQAS